MLRCVVVLVLVAVVDAGRRLKLVQDEQQYGCVLQEPQLPKRQVRNVIIQIKTRYSNPNSFRDDILVPIMPN